MLLNVENIINQGFVFLINNIFHIPIYPPKIKQKLGNPRFNTLPHAHTLKHILTPIQHASLVYVERKGVRVCVVWCARMCSRLAHAKFPVCLPWFDLIWKGNQ